LEHLTASQTIPLKLRQELAGEVFNHTAYYDSIIADYFNKVNDITQPDKLTISYKKVQECRYGENPHQSAAIYGDFIKQFQLIHGKELSYNNVMDMNAISDLILEFDEPTVAIVKHTNPCGVASADTNVEAYRKAFATDKVSPFGGIIALNGEVDIDFANEVHSLFSEVIIAKSFTDEALSLLSKKKDRRLVIANYDILRQIQLNPKSYSFRSVPNGLLYQQTDNILFHPQQMECVTSRKPTEEEHQKMLFA